MRIARFFAGSALVGGALILAAPGMALADETKISVTPTTVAAGNSITFKGNCAGETSEAQFWYVLKGSDRKRGNAEGDKKSGNWQATIAIPDSTEAGTYVASIKCGAEPAVTASFTVTKDEPSPSPSADTTVTVSPTTVNPGGTITVSGTCDKGADNASIWYGNADGSGQPYAQKDGLSADSSGKISGSLAITPETPTGSYVAVLRCDKSVENPPTASFTVSTGGTTAGDGGSLGGNGTILVLVGGGMLAAASLGGAIYMQRHGFGVAA
ncbi:MAG TPA: hypothetical protein VE172_05310 [Stackebrandtia sp.]|jgi:hypothetical protein|uniref:hypothetical protein n=1 Tax=Stackebrandtia sp. TaxID=2023065 RepID=UPI002D5348B2|nr:hypothetical protein [Stackebrandtia sp.]HZE38212.1 hypothetical protein [Stackebrandtia sp.]